MNYLAAMNSNWMKNLGLPLLVISLLIILSFLLFGDLEHFFLEVLNEAQEQKQTYAILSFLILASDILLPIPSSIIMFINGYVLGTGLGGLISIGGLMLGSVVGYFLGKFSFFSLNQKENHSAMAMMESYGLVAIIISRGLPVLAEAVSIVCGYNQMSFKKYLLYSFIGYLPLCFLYSFFGQLGQDKNLFLLTFLMSLILAAILWFVTRNYLKRLKR